MCDKLRVSSPVALESKQPNQNMLEIQTVAYYIIRIQYRTHRYVNQLLRSIHLHTLDQDSCIFSFTHKSCKFVESKYDTSNGVNRKIHNTSII
jgi:hypothetical protein